MGVADDEQSRGQDGTPSRTVFRAFALDAFLEWPAWPRMREILESSGGSYGLSGPRGAGKSWLMRRAIDYARNPEDETRPRGLGLWYPSPSEYDPHAFLAALSEGLANEIERRFRRERSGLARVLTSWRAHAVLAVIAALVVALLLSGGGTLRPWSIHSYTPDQVTGALLTGVVVFLLLRSLGPILDLLRPEAALLREAAIVRERARYSSTHRESSEVGAEGGRGVVARVQTARAKELVERPATLSTLVNDFRALAEQGAALTDRVVIAIDELDKMDDPDKVRSLLRDIKGVFEVPGVHFLVSVSEEAARNLNLGALTGRSEFNSSFYTVIELPPISPDACADLLFHRSQVPRDLGRVLGVLAGGNPREVLRLAEFVAQSPSATGAADERRGYDIPAGEAVIATLKEEALSLRREIVTAVDSAQGDSSHPPPPPIGHEARTGAFVSLPEAAFADDRAFINFTFSVIDDMWEPEWADEGWTRRFLEPWRRLSIRLAVGARLVEQIGGDEELPQLRDVITTASQSAAVARIVFEEGLRVETRSNA